MFKLKVIRAILATNEDNKRINRGVVKHIPIYDLEYNITKVEIIITTPKKERDIESKKKVIVNIVLFKELKL